MAASKSKAKGPLHKTENHVVFRADDVDALQSKLNRIEALIAASIEAEMGGNMHKDHRLPLLIMAEELLSEARTLSQGVAHG